MGIGFGMSKKKARFAYLVVFASCNYSNLFLSCMYFLYFKNGFGFFDFGFWIMLNGLATFKF